MDLIYKYKGVAIFGAPGSGKTTLAKAIVKKIPNSDFFEAYEHVIVPASSFDKYPQQFSKFVRELIIKKRGKHKPNRKRSQEIFLELGRRYGSDAIGQIIVSFHEQKRKDGFLIISGARGIHNAKFLKKHGYLVMFLEAPKKVLVKRVALARKNSAQKASDDHESEERKYQTSKIESIADLSVDGSSELDLNLVRQVTKLIAYRECVNCVNNDLNPFIEIEQTGLCSICSQYKKHFNVHTLKREFQFLKSLIGKGTSKYDAMVGISGGKDSTATLHTVRKMGFKPLAFTFDIGYYPKHIFKRSFEVAQKLKVDHEIIDIRKYIRENDRVSYELSAKLFEQPDSPDLKNRFVKQFALGRQHYSAKCKHSMAFARTCQLCRHTVIRAYYAEAIKHKVPVIILGINEWAGLSQDYRSQKVSFSAVRKLKPYKNKPEIYVVHLPFLLQRKLNDSRKILRDFGWKIPEGEHLVESNSNSCLFARAAEHKAKRLLGFHPDATRLAREVTSGFITKKEAKKALEKRHHSNYSVRDILVKSGII